MMEIFVNQSVVRPVVAVDLVSERAVDLVVDLLVDLAVALLLDLVL